MNITDGLRESFAESSSVPVLVKWEDVTHLHQTGIRHATISAWHPMFPDGRRVAYVADPDQQDTAGVDSTLAKALRLRAQVNVQIFPRATVLLERHFEIQRESFLASCLAKRWQDDHEEVGRRLRVSVGGTKIEWRASDADMELRIGEGLWSLLWPKSTDMQTAEGGDEERNPATEPGPADVEGFYGHNLRRLSSLMAGAVEDKWHHTVDVGRYLRRRLDDNLRLARRMFLARCQASDTDYLLYAANELTKKSRIIWQHKREFPGSDLSDSHIKLCRDFEIIDDFISFLQCLCAFDPAGRLFESHIHFSVLDRKLSATALLAVYGDGAGTAHRPALDEFVKVFQQQVVSPLVRDDLRRLFDELDKDGNGMRFAKAETRVARDSKVLSWSNKLNESLSSMENNSVKVATRAIVTSAMGLAAKLVLSHAVHEGRPLDFSFVCGPSSGLWPEVEETLSEERFAASTAVMKREDRDAELDRLARLIGAHWSVFQADRVFGLIDIYASAMRRLPVLKSVVRVRRPPAWGGVYSELVEHLVQFAGPCFVIHASGTGVVSLYRDRAPASDKSGEDQPLLRWNLREDHIETLGSPASDVVDEMFLTLGLPWNCSLKVPLRAAVEEVSGTQGEGGMLIAVGDGSDHLQPEVKRLTRDMDPPEQRMAWRDGKRPEWLDKTLLRAMLILDGATVLRGLDSIEPRAVVYPHIHCLKAGVEPCDGCELPATSAFSVFEVREDATDPGCPVVLKDAGRIKDNAKRLLFGKGSKHHGAANLSLLLYKLNREKQDGFRILTVSADGNVKAWPDALLVGLRGRKQQ